MSYTFDQIANPEKYGLVMCSHCNGYGSSLKDPIGVDKCTKCGGSGLVPKEGVPRSPYDQYKTECPDCGNPLHVVEVTLSANGKVIPINTPLQSDGFEFDPNDDDLKNCSTEDEKVECTICGKKFDLGDLMND